MPTLIILRHGQSVWNVENRFTGWVDVNLTALGEAEALKAGELIKPYYIAVAFTSALKRAIETMQIILKAIGEPDLPFTRSSNLNERNYGDLQGKDKTETEKKFGLEQVMLWRRSYDEVPPHGESLKTTYERVVPYYQQEIEPQLLVNKNVLIVAHGNSLRALMMYLEKMSPHDIADVNLATGAPRKYEFDSAMNLLTVGYL